MNHRWFWDQLAQRLWRTSQRPVVWQFGEVIAAASGFDVLLVPVVVSKWRRRPAGRIVAISADEARRLAGHLGVMRLKDAKASVVYLPGQPNAEAALQELVRRCEDISDSARPRRMYLSNGTEAWVQVSCVGSAWYASVWHLGLEFPVTLSVRAHREAGEPIAVAQETVNAMSILLAEMIGDRELRPPTDRDPAPGAGKPWRFVVAGDGAEGVHVVWIGLLGPDRRPLWMEHQDARSLLTKFVTQNRMTETRKEVDS